MTTDIELALAKGKIVGARKLLQEFYEAQDRQEFNAKLRAEYDELYPSTREMNENEKVLYLEDLRQEDETIDAQTIEYPKVAIDYSEDESYVTFEEYKNETRVVSEAVEATYDEDGMELTPYQAEVVELVRPYIPNDVSVKVEDYLSPSIAQKAKDEARQYLTNTDWYVVRYSETGVEMPQDILDKRQACRDMI